MYIWWVVGGRGRSMACSVPLFKGPSRGHLFLRLLSKPQTEYVSLLRLFLFFYSIQYSRFPFFTFPIFNCALLSVMNEAFLDVLSGSRWAAFQLYRFSGAKYYSFFYLFLYGPNEGHNYSSKLINDVSLSLFLMGTNLKSKVTGRTWCNPFLWLVHRKRESLH